MKKILEKFAGTGTGTWPSTGNRYRYQESTGTDISYRYITWYRYQHIIVYNIYKLYTIYVNFIQYI
jgi:hypothetical protein